MNCRILKILISIVFLSILLSLEMYAESLNDKVFCISNPKTNNQIITNKNGNVILASVDPEFEELAIIHDVLNNE